MTIDRSSWWWRRGRLTLGLCAGLSLAGWVTNPLQDQAWGAVRAHQPELSLGQFQDALGQGLILGTFGGFRSIMADFVWLQEYSYWEKMDRPQTEALVHLATTLDPSSAYFWENGGRTIGLDIPIWRILAGGGFAKMPKVEQDALMLEQGQRAIEFLDQGLMYVPNNRGLITTKAQIYTYRFNDKAKAAEMYRLVADLPDSPRMFMRIYADAMRNLDDPAKTREGYNYLRKRYPELTLPSDKEDREITWERLRALEDELNLPPAERLPEAAAPPGWKPEPPVPIAAPAAARGG